MAEAERVRNLSFLCCLVCLCVCVSCFVWERSDGSHGGVWKGSGVGIDMYTSPVGLNWFVCSRSEVVSLSGLRCRFGGSVFVVGGVEFDGCRSFLFPAGEVDGPLMMSLDFLRLSACARERCARTRHSHRRSLMSKRRVRQEVRTGPLLGHRHTTKHTRSCVRLCSSSLFNLLITQARA
jgi:hypothetical protein